MAASSTTLSMAAAVPTGRSVAKATTSTAEATATTSSTGASTAAISTSGGNGAAEDLFVGNFADTGIDYFFDATFVSPAEAVEEGDDTLQSGGAATDRVEVLLGEGGDDELTYRSGLADLDGGAGRDRATLDKQAGAVSLRIADAFGQEILHSAADLDTQAEIRDFATDIRQFDFLGLEFVAGDDSVFLFDIEEVKTAGSDEGDVAVGMVGRSQLFTGLGDNVLLSRAGDDLLVGGARFDRYVFGPGFGSDVIARGRGRRRAAFPGDRLLRGELRDRWRRPAHFAWRGPAARPILRGRR